MTLFVSPRQTEPNLNGIIAAGWTYYFYEVGTTTPKTVYSDSSLTTALGTSVESVSNGRFPAIFYSGAVKVILKDADGVEQWTEDNYNPSLNPLEVETISDLAATDVSGRNETRVSGIKEFFVNTGQNNPAKAGPVLTSGDDFFVYDSQGNQHAYGGIELWANKFDILSSKIDGDNISRLNDLIEYASSLSADGEKTIIRIPATAGILDFSDAIQMRSNVALWNHGYCRFTGGDAVGHFVLCASANGPGNAGAIENYEVAGGGVFDSNFQANDNVIACSNRDNGDADSNKNGWIHHLRLINAKHGGSHITDITDPADIGRGGGKCVSIQFGCKSLLLHDLIADNCELGFAVEGKNSNNGYVRDIIAHDINIKNSRYIGMYLTGAYSSASYGEAIHGRLSGFVLENCGYGANSFNSDAVAYDMGVITMSGAANLKVDATIRNLASGVPTNKTTLIRGSHRNCEIDIKAYTRTVANVINSAPAGIYNQVQAGRLHNTVNIDWTMVSGSLENKILRSDSSYEYENSKVNVNGLDYHEGTPQALDTTDYQDGIEESVQLNVWDKHTHRVTEYLNGANRSNFDSTVSVNDDSVLVKKLKSTDGVVHVFTVSGSGMESAIFHYKTTGTDVLLSLIDTSSSFDVTTGVLTGITGTDARLTVSVDSSRNFYVENRRGAVLPVLVKEVW